jgi:hypothetical protein
MEAKRLGKDSWRGDCENGPPRNLGGYGCSLGLVFAEDASVGVLVMVFSAEYGAAKERVKFGGKEHGEEWSRKVDPERSPDTGKESAAECARRIHAHTRDR